MQTDWWATIIAPQWSPALATAVQQEIADCCQLTDKVDQPIHLVSVGGLDNQDLPMSGNLQATECLQNCPNLYSLLGCVLPTMGRVCLIRRKSTEGTQYPLYRNAAYPLFYQANLIALGDFYVLLETRREATNKNAEILFDLDQLQQITNNNASVTLNVACPRLDALTPALTEKYLNSILTYCTPLLDETDAQMLITDSQHFLARWRQYHAQFGNSYTGEWSYQSALNTFRETCMPLVYRASQHLKNKTKQATDQALKIIATQLNMIPPAPQRVNRKVLLKARHRKQFPVDSLAVTPHFERPIFIVSAPRAGSTLLFETLSQFPGIWSTGEENHALLEDIAGLHPSDKEFTSNRLEAVDATGSVRTSIIKAFTGKLHNRKQQYYLDMPKSDRPNSIRFLEKTPKNALRIPFIKALFPDALLVYLHRSFNANVSSLIDGWRSQRFIAYRNLPGYESRHWSFLLTPNWSEKHACSIADIAAYQWKISHQIIQDDLAKLPSQDWLSIDYQDLITQPSQVIQEFADFAGLQWDEVVQNQCENGLPVSRLTLSSPQRHKWKKHRYFLNAHNAQIPG